MTEAKSAQNWNPGDCPMCGSNCAGGAHRNALAEDGVETSEQYQAMKNESAQPQLPPRPERLMPACGVDSTMRVIPHMVDIEDGSYIRYADYSALETENKFLKASLDEARSGCVAWECAVSSLEAHLQDRIAMKDESQPDIYLSILQSDVANVTRDTEQIREATWHRERIYAARAEKAEAERDQALEMIREYRLSSISHRLCSTDFGYCPTCIKADELLSRETKET